MANFAQAIHNPSEDLTFEELKITCLIHGLMEEGEEYEYQELEQILEEFEAECVAADYYTY